MPSGELLGLVLLAASTWASDVGLIGLTGAVACRPLLAAIPDRPVPAAGRPPERVLVTLAGASAVVLLLGAAARLYAQTWSVFGLDEPVTLELVRVVGLESRWGARWLPQAGLAVAAAAGVVWWTRQPRGGWWMTGLAAAGSWVALPLTGHAMSGASRLPWIAQVAHGLAAGLWIGTLAAVVGVAFRLARDPAGHPRIGALVATLLSPGDHRSRGHSRVRRSERSPLSRRGIRSLVDRVRADAPPQGRPVRGDGCRRRPTTGAG